MIATGRCWCSAVPLAIDLGKRFLGRTDPGMLEWSDGQMANLRSTARARHKAAKTTGPFQVDHASDCD
jgi:hypothetical protein